MSQLEFRKYIVDNHLHHTCIYTHTVGHILYKTHTANLELFGNFPSSLEKENQRHIIKLSYQKPIHIHTLFTSFQQSGRDI